ncbi:MAG TPA: 4-alpha-glucanotransferase [Planctomycetota bacterium]|nr:4-alpha-glucanotransferase [Planctomycetota bacterium]
MRSDATEEILDELAALRGIESGYVDFQGKPHATSRETKVHILAAMGLDVSTDADARRALAEERARPWRRLLEPVTVVREGAASSLGAGFARALALSVRGAIRSSVAGRLTVRLRVESGEIVPLRVDGAVAEETREVEGEPYTRIRIPLPPLPIGVHEIEAAWAGRSPEAGTGRLVVAPAQCFLPEGRFYGFTVGIWALRGRSDVGVGTIGDVAELAAWSARELGADLLGLPPLHATANRPPADQSPYGPLTRLYRNPIYLDVRSLPEVAASARAAESLREAGAPATDVVDYERVDAIVRRALRAAFDDGEPPPPAFDAYRREQGAELERFATFEAIRAHLGPSRWPWWNWPEELRSADAPGVAAFRTQRTGDVTFHAWLQWLVDRELAAAQRSAREAGMRIGLYHDLAVGSSGAGAEAWGRPDLFVREVELGAPPDEFQRLGQTWGVLPMDPVRLRELGYEPFLALLRAAMRHGGALRLDHVMGLARLFWVPAGRPAAEGAYVRYPLDDLLGCVALESVRRGALVVGEDLGTVPGGLRERLASERVLSCRLALFERGASGEWLPPESYPDLSVASFGTHDLPTMAGLWRGRGLGRDAEGERRAWRMAIGRDPAAEGPPLDDLIVETHRFLARASSRVVLASVADVLRVEEQTNVPGTTTEHPNWSLRLPLDLEEMRDDATLLATGRALARRRRG